MLYNVTFSVWDTSNWLVPYVPYSAAEDEDRKTDRVCFADSIENCIAAIGSCNRNLHTDCLIAVRYVDEKSLDPSKIVTPQELFDTGRVPDALENHEYWYLGEVRVEREIYKIKNYTFEYAIAFTCIAKDDLAYIINRYNPCNLMKVNEAVDDAYERTVMDLYRQNRFDDADAFEEEVAGLPWAKRIKISELVMERTELY